jgi:acyl-CoA thioesterase-1
MTLGSMLRVGALVLGAVGTTFPASGGPQPPVPKIVALGDSLTSGHGIGAADAYPAVLQQRLDENGYHYQVVNAGVSGDTSARALRRYEEALDGDVRILIVALGANDGLRAVSVAQLTSNLSTIIEDAQRRGIAVVLVGMDALPVGGWAYTRAFHHAYEELAARFGVPLVPSFLLRILMDTKLMQSDRAHPNKAGARAIAEIIWPFLEPLLQKPDDGVRVVSERADMRQPLNPTARRRLVADK